MKNKKCTFETLLLSLEPHFELPDLFDDFLTISLCLLSVDSLASKPSPFIKELYRNATHRYWNCGCGLDPILTYKALNREMAARKHTMLGNDVLGEFYENYLLERMECKMGLLPWPLCLVIAQRRLKKRSGSKAAGMEFYIDPACQSGRMLMATAEHRELIQRYYGIETEERLVKMATLNLFLNGIYQAEVLWVDEDSLLFRRAYQTSLRPFGIKRIDNSEDSQLWQIMGKASQSKPVLKRPHRPLIIPLHRH